MPFTLERDELGFCIPNRHDQHCGYTECPCAKLTIEELLAAEDYQLTICRDYFKAKYPTLPCHDRTPVYVGKFDHNISRSMWNERMFDVLPDGSIGLCHSGPRYDPTVLETAREELVTAEDKLEEYQSTIKGMREVLAPWEKAAKGIRADINELEAKIAKIEKEEGIESYKLVTTNEQTVQVRERQQLSLPLPG